MSLGAKVAIIVVTYNGEKWLDTCLGCLYGQSADVEYIVIDNASSDHTVDEIEKKYPNVNLIKSQKNLGFGGANNLGFEFALKNNFDYCFLLNQDAKIDLANLGLLIETAQNNPDLGIISPVHYKNETEVENLFKEYLEKNRTVIQQIIQLPFVNAALWLLPISTVKKIGGFNPLYFHYGEDVDYVNRVHYFQYKLGVDLRAKAYHLRNINIKEDRKKRSKKSHFGPWPVRYYTLLTNVNYSTVYAFYLGVRLFWVSLAKHLIKMNWNSVNWDLKIGLEVLKKIPKIIQNRDDIKKGEKFINFKN